MASAYWRLMTEAEILDEFRSAEALLEGHFILSSGLRSSRYLQCARVLMDPRAPSGLPGIGYKLPPAGAARSTRRLAAMAA